MPVPHALLPLTYTSPTVYLHSTTALLPCPCDSANYFYFHIKNYRALSKALLIPTILSILPNGNCYYTPPTSNRAAAPTPSLSLFPYPQTIFVIIVVHREKETTILPTINLSGEVFSSHTLHIQLPRGKKNIARNRRARLHASATPPPLQSSLLSCNQLATNLKPICD